jgi:hypothetical protein
VQTSWRPIRISSYAVTPAMPHSLCLFLDLPVCLHSQNLPRWSGRSKRLAPLQQQNRAAISRQGIKTRTRRELPPHAPVAACWCPASCFLSHSLDKDRRSGHERFSTRELSVESASTSWAVLPTQASLSSSCAPGQDAISRPGVLVAHRH